MTWPIVADLVGGPKDGEILQVPELGPIRIAIFGPIEWAGPDADPMSDTFQEAEYRPVLDERHQPVMTAAGRYRYQFAYLR